MADVAADPYLDLRPTLFAVAYRMLGSVADAEDLVQEAYLRWQQVDQASVESPRAFLVTVVTRLALDQMRSARARRETYVGPWLPDPVPTAAAAPPGPVADGRADPAAMAELTDSLSMAFLVVLEELSPLQRAAFLLHDVFGYSHEEAGRIIGRSAAACRQLVKRARQQVADRRRRFDTDAARVEQVTRRFVDACITGDLQSVLDLMAPDVVVWTDGGGLVKAARRPISGASKAARFVIAITSDGVPPGAEVTVRSVNGQPAVVIADGGEPLGVVLLDVADGQVYGVRVVNNPEKLTALRG